MNLIKWITKQFSRKPLLAQPAVSNCALIEVWDADLDSLKSKWVNEYMNNGYDVEEPVDVKWNRKTMSFQYRFIVKKHCC